jgi:hypothetical protein
MYDNFYKVPVGLNLTGWISRQSPIAYSPTSQTNSRRNLSSWPSTTPTRPFLWSPFLVHHSLYPVAAYPPVLANTGTITQANFAPRFPPDVILVRKIMNTAQKSQTEVLDKKNEVEITILFFLVFPEDQSRQLGRRPSRKTTTVVLRVPSHFAPHGASRLDAPNLVTLAET